MGIERLRVESRSLTETVLDAIRQAIMDKTLAPGDPVPESGLAAALGVSKTPVREALVRLQHAGLVLADGGRVLRVVTPSVELVRQSYQVRAGLESMAARLAVPHLDQDGADALTASAQSTLAVRQARRRDPTGYHDADREFHHLLSSLAGNPRLSRLIDESFLLCWVLRQRDASQITYDTTVGQAHVDIAAAVTRGDEDAAAAAMLDHIIALSRLTVRAMGADPE